MNGEISMERLKSHIRRRRAWAAGAFGIALAVSAPALSADTFAAMGLGTGTCAQFAELRRVTPERAETYFFDWAQGYLSGWNAAQLVQGKPYRDLNGMTVDEQRAFLRRYCEDNPDSTYFHGVVRLQQQFEMITPQNASSPGSRSKGE
jgi:hypothetical protein